MRQIALLRGINLGSRNRIAMPELRRRLAEVGYEDARTYLQSGNIVLASDRDPEDLADELSRQIADWFGLSVAVLVRTRDQLAAVVALNPLGQIAVNPNRYQVSFLSAELDPSLVEKLHGLAAESEGFAVRGREAYAWHPEGVARSRLWSELARSRPDLTATSRNWTTVTNLLTMADT